MMDLNLSDRTKAEDYRNKIDKRIAKVFSPSKLPGSDDLTSQQFYLKFKKLISKFVDEETEKLKKSVHSSDNCYLQLLMRTALVDAVVAASFKTSIWLYNRSRKEPLEEKDVPVAIIARGGYGREEMYFCSDVDIQIVSKKFSVPNSHEAEAAKGVINFFEYLFVFQDIFPTASSSGFSETDAKGQELDQKKLPAFFSLLEHRLVTGNNPVYSEFKSSVKTASLFHKEEILQYCFQHKHYYDIQNTVFQQEPNLKEELRRLYWALSLTRIREGFKKINQFELLHELYDSQKLSAPAFKSLQYGLKFLARARLLLHCHQQGSHKDVLRYEVREKIARAMGFELKEFYEEYFFQAAYPVKRYSRNLFWESMAFDTQKVTDLSETFAVNAENQIFFTGDPDKHSWDRPSSIFQLFAWIAQNNYHLSYPVIRSIEHNVGQMEPLFLSELEKKEAHKYFQSIISGKYFAKAIRFLHQFGLLQHFIPEFKNISGLLQDIYVHKFPTDFHVLAALDGLNVFDISKDADPFLLSLYRSLKDKTPLKLAVVLHDIGKGIKGENQNEELVGAQAVPRILESLGYTEKQLVANVAFLVEKHLLMRDLLFLDPDEDDTHEMIWDLVNRDTARLKMLILLTYADRSGTKMKMSTQQIAQLKHFYQNTLHHKKRKSVSDPVKLEFVKMMRLPRDVQSQMEVYSEFRKSSESFAAEIFFKQTDPSILAMGTKDQKGLLFKVTTVLAFNQVSIVEANIHTVEDNAFDIFKICDASGKPMEFANFSFTQRQIKDDLRKVFVDKQPVSSLYKGRTLTSQSNGTRYDDIRLKIKVIGRAVKVQTRDILGSMMLQTKVFAKMNMEIQRAVIHSHLGTASNIFYMRPEDVHQIIHDEKRFKKRLLEALAPLLENRPIF